MAPKFATSEFMPPGTFLVRIAPRYEQYRTGDAVPETGIYTVTIIRTGSLMRLFCTRMKG
jgi:hypothetical protein